MTRMFGVVFVVVCLFREKLGYDPAVRMTENAIIVDCDTTLHLVSSDQHGYLLHSHKTVLFISCPLPNTTYLSDLVAFNINVTAVKHLRLTWIRDKSQPLQAYHFKGLSSLTSLDITYIYKRYDGLEAPRPSAGFLEPLTGLVNLSVGDMELPPLPVATALGNVTLEGGSSTGEWGGCQMMQQLAITRWDLDKVPERWLSHCPTLYCLTLNSIDRLTGAALQRVTGGLRALRELVVRDSGLQELPGDFMAGSRHLQRLDLSHNNLQKVRINPFPELVELDLRDNEITGQEAAAMPLLQQRELRVLRLSGNEDLDLCKSDRTWKGHPKLEVLELKLTGSSELCFEKFYSLQYLDLRFCNITKLNFKGIPVSRAPTLQMTLDDSTVQEVLFDKDDYATTRELNYSHRYGDPGFKINRINMLVNMLVYARLECDCKHAWLARALRDLPQLNMTNVICNDNTLLAKTPSKLLECEKRTCAANCTCRTAWRDHAIDMDCRGGNLETIPHMPGLRSLRAPNNRIEFINANELADTLVRLDVRSNLLSRLEPAAVEALFSVSERNVSLAGNPLDCDCVLIQALHDHKTQVEDYQQVTCANGNVSVYDVVANDLCRKEPPPPGDALTVPLVLCGVLVAFLALAAAVYCRYEREVKVFLYSHGCWLSCILEEELDADRRYDAFVSFSHGDEDYIFGQLMPGLENEPNPYNVCVHYRDWIPGEFIPAQITHSVQQSRRTIIVLSSNYLASPWGLLEFRTAHEDTLRGGRPRIIVILLEDVVGDARLSSELHGYLRSNTYVKHDDPWFWRKLRYALPHRSAAGGSRAATRRHTPVVRMEALSEA